MNTLAEEKKSQEPRTTIEVSSEASEVWSARMRNEWIDKLKKVINDLLTLTVTTKNSDGTIVYAKTEIKLDGDWINYLHDVEDWHLEYHQESVQTALERRDALIKIIGDLLNIISKMQF